MQCLAWCANPLLAVQFHSRGYLKQVQPLIVSTLSLVGQNQYIGDHDYIQFMTRDNRDDGVTGLHFRELPKKCDIYKSKFSCVKEPHYTVATVVLTCK